ALPLAPRLLEEPARLVERRVLPHEARRGEGQRLGRLLLLEPRLDLGVALLLRLPVEREPGAQEDRAGREVERPVREVAGGRLELADGAVGVEEVDRGDEVA